MKRLGKGFTYLFFILMAYILTGILLMALAAALYHFQLGSNVVGAGVIMIYVASTFLAGCLAGKKAKSRKYLWGFLMGAGYYLILAAVSLMTDRGASDLNFFSAFLLCAGGGTLGGMVS